MNVKNSEKWSTVPRPTAYAVALLITLMAFAIRYVLHPYLEPNVPFEMILIACLLVEYLVGLGPALLSVVIGFMLGMHYFIAPYASSDGVSRSDVIITVNFIFITLFVIGLIEYLRRTLYSNQLLLKVSHSRHKISLHRENDRLYLAKKAAVAILPLEKLFVTFDKVLLLELPGGVIYPQELLFQLCPMLCQEKDKSQWIEFVHPEDRDNLRAALAKVKGGEVSQHRLQARIMNSENNYTDFQQLLVERMVVGTIRLIVLKAIVEDIA